MNYKYLLLAAMLPLNALAQRLNVTVKNPMNTERHDVPVVIDVKQYAGDRNVTSGVVTSRIIRRNRPELIQEIPSQFNGQELIFTANVPAAGEVDYEVELMQGTPQRKFPERVHAHMKLWDRKFQYPKINSIEFQGDVPSRTMYDAIYGHGAMWESEYVGFRVYMDNRQSIDLYGKKFAQMELDTINFYSSPERMAQGYGEDILWAGQSVAAGSFRGMRKGAPCYVDTVAARGQRVLEEGPIRTVVEVYDRDWLYNGHPIQMRQLYTMYAGHRDVQVDVMLQGVQADDIFATGVQKLEIDNEGYTESDGLVASWGRNVPEKGHPELVEGVGMGVFVPSYCLRSVQEDSINYLCLLRPNANGHIRYHLAVAAEMQQEGGFKRSSRWFDWLKTWRRELEHPCTVTVTTKNE